METLEGFKRHASQKLDEATFGLDKEMHACESMRVSTWNNDDDRSM